MTEVSLGEIPVIGQTRTVILRFASRMSYPVETTKHRSNHINKTLVPFQPYEKYK